MSKKHILSFGATDNPEMILFQGAIGNAYISAYRILERLIEVFRTTEEYIWKKY